MKKFNIIIAKRERDEYLRWCLHFLNKANREKKHDVNIYVIDDSQIVPREDDNYNNVKVFRYYWRVSNDFNKSSLLNYGLKIMRHDFDYVSIVDVDIVYSSEFFDKIASRVDDNIWYVSSGYKLTAEAMYEDFNVINWQDLSRYTDNSLIEENIRQLYPSQITLSVLLYYKILLIMKWKNLYNDKFIGWGGEDSVLSSLSSDLQRKGILKKIYDQNMWLHLYHKKLNNNAKQYEKNKILFHELVKKNREYLRSIK